METLYPRIDIDREKLETFCQKWKITELSLFGSVLRDDFGPDSDVDVLVTFAPDAKWSLFDIVRAERELSQILGRRAEIGERIAIEKSENYIIRREILSSARRIYAA
jgi:predicted nucleotidyltransferase